MMIFMKMELLSVEDAMRPSFHQKTSSTLAAGGLPSMIASRTL